MKTSHLILVLLLLLCPYARTAAQQVRREADGVTLLLPQSRAGGARMVRLRVVNERIMRLQATPETAWPEWQSLTVLPQPRFRRFRVEQTPQEVCVTTDSMQARLRLKDGRVRYFDAQGRLLLAETEEGGKRFSRFEVPQREIGVGTLTPQQRTAWSIGMQFDSPPDEAFYGLGQHQSDEFNMKGRNEELFQYNTKIAVPFVLSTRRYGLLWDNYSYARWGNPADYLQLHHAFKLYDSEGREGALTGRYVAADGRTLTRREDSLFFENSETIGHLPAGFPLRGSTVVFEGSIEPSESGVCRFLLYYAGYVRVSIDGREVVSERWRTAWNPNSYKFEARLEARRRHHLRVTWRPDGDVSYCGLRVAAPRSESEQQGRLSVWCEMGRQLDYYMIAGATADDVISGYRRLTGRAPVLPRWALGFWQSRERYSTQAELVGTLAEFRRRHIPVDNIVQDWNYWPENAWGSHEFEASRYPDPQAMLDSVHALHGRFMLSVWPKFYASTAHYRELDSLGWIYRQAVRDSIRDWVGPGYVGSFYDAYSPGARRLFWRQLDEHLYSRFGQGIDAWWMDASEPNVRDCTPMWYRKALCGPTALGASTEYFNAYSLVNAEAIVSGQREAAPRKRAFLLTRSGFAGLQRFGTASWSGDIGTRWEDMRAQMSAGLNYAASGLPFWGMDIGGFCVEDRYVRAQREFDRTGRENDDLKEWRELQARWHQFGCFVPLYRAHGQWPQREAWHIAPEGHPAYESIVYYHRLRYRLMPYLYSMAGWVSLHDYTMMRPLPMDFPSDTAARAISDQWMFGPSLMPCPVGHYGARARSVWLPAGRGWTDFATGRHYAGGQRVELPAPYGRLPLLVPDGSILPLGRPMEWSDQLPQDTIDIHVFGGADATFALYEDDGVSTACEQGAYAVITFRYEAATRLLTISQRKGRFEGMLSRRTFRIVSHQPKQPPMPVEAPLTEANSTLVRYDGRSVAFAL